jgi:type IV secretion system protein VirB11
VQAVIPPAVEPDTIALSFRNPSSRDYTLEDYAAHGSFDRIGERSQDRQLQAELLALKAERRWLEFQRLAVDAHLTILACGETGSGKTTYLRSLCSYIDPNERIVTIEDAREMWLPNQPNSVHLLYSHGDQGESGTTSSDLLKACMRLKPDRILPAELRGGEAYDFVDAAFSGHRGSMSSLHAGDAVTAFMRFVGLLRESNKGRGQSERELKRLAWCSIDALVIWDKPRDGQPVIADIHYEPELRERARAAFMELA